MTDDNIRTVPVFCNDANSKCLVYEELKNSVLVGHSIHRGRKNFSISLQSPCRKIIRNKNTYIAKIVNILCNLYKDIINFIIFFVIYAIYENKRKL